MEQSLKVLFLSSEVSPFSRSGIIGDVCAAIPRQLKKLGHDVRVITPRYRFIRDRKFGLRDVARLRSVPINFNGVEQEFAVKSGFIPQSKVQVYFVEKPEFYDRDGIYSNPTDNKPFEDNGLRFSFLCHASLQLMVHLQWIPDIIHCNGWQTGLIPFLLSSGEVFQDKLPFSRLIMQVHQFEEFGLFENGCAPGILCEEENRDLVEWDGKFSFMKAGIQYSDSIVLSQSIDEAEKKQQLKDEFWTQFNGKKDSFKQFGKSGKCLEWNPVSDFSIEQAYSEVDFIHGKILNKRSLQRDLKFRLMPELPIGLIVADFSQANHLEFLMALRKEQSVLKCQWVIVNVGGNAVPKEFEQWRKSNRDSVFITSEINEKLYRKFLSSCDFSMKLDGLDTKWNDIPTHLNYGVIPYVVHFSDKADDSGWWSDFRDISEEFTYKSDPESLSALLNAIETQYSSKDVWNGWIEQILKQRLDWENIVNHLLDIYENSLNSPSCRDTQQTVEE